MITIGNNDSITINAIGAGVVNKADTITLNGLGGTKALVENITTGNLQANGLDVNFITGKDTVLPVNNFFENVY